MPEAVVYDPLILLSREGEKFQFTLNEIERRVIVREVFLTRTYFPTITTDQNFDIRESDIVIDIGAQVGIFSVYAAKIAKKGYVYAFEPVGENFARLIEHVNINSIKNISLVNKGVSDRNKSAELFLCEGNTGGHSLNENKFRSLKEKPRGAVTIECVSLQSIFDTNGIEICDFLKLDCEGEEANILTNLPDPYFSRIRKIALEFHAPIVNEVALAVFLTTKGFRVTISNVGSTLGMIFAYRKQ